MNKRIKYIFCLVLVISLFFTFKPSVSAKTLRQLRNELSNAEARYKNNQSNKQQTEAEIASTKARVEELRREKERVQKEIEALNEELERLAEEIKKMEKEMKSIINYYQLSNSNSLYLEYAFNATSFTDFIYRLAVAEQLSEYRKTTIEKYNNLIEENKKKIEELAAKQVAQNKLEDELSKQLSKLRTTLSGINSEAVDIKDEIADLKADINKYANTYKCGEDEDLTACINRSIGYSGLPSAAGFYRPVTAGTVNANYGYSAYYGSYHDGLDIGVSHGTPVYPVADGRVVKVNYRASCGGNMVYIVHNVNGVNYTSGYFHLASINVSPNQVVTHDSVIGYSGGVPWIETWDGCSTGAHLHLQIGTGRYTIDYFWYSDYQARSFDPRNVINFPGWGGYFQGR